jgi:RNA polymerase sigma-70 factor (ECF subfamily)
LGYLRLLPWWHSKNLQSSDVFDAPFLQSVNSEVIIVTSTQECDVAEQFLNEAGEDSFNLLFRIFSPQLVAFFRRRGHETGIAEDLSQEVMLTVYRKARQVRDHKLFRAWLFKVARHTACRHFAQRSRQVPTVDLTDLNELLPAPHQNPFGPASEFNDWMKLLDAQERETMTLRFVEGWEYHEIAEVQELPIGTVLWRVFNSKKKLAPHLTPVRDDIVRMAA